MPLLYDSTNGDVQFIDYEYAAVAPVGLDIANHFSGCTELIEGESVTFDTSFYPTAEQQLHFLELRCLGPRGPRFSKHFKICVRIFQKLHPIFKLAKNLVNNYKSRTSCTASGCKSYWFCKIGENC